MRPLSTRNLRPFLASAILALAVGCAFWVPAMSAGRGYFPAPLDDVYIHFDFARSLASGHPFEWMPGNGYSSGETSPLYAVVLAAGWLLGFRDRLVAVFGAIVAVLAVASFVRSVQKICRPCPTSLTVLIALLLLSVGVVDWTLFSGMEVALFAAALGRTLETLVRSRARLDERAGQTREGSQWRLGMWGAALVLLRPEAGVLVAVFALSAARGAGGRSGIKAVLRAGMPGALATAAVLVTNRLATGEAQSAGAQLKLLSSNPYLSDVDRARVYVENLVTFALKGFTAELSALARAWLIVPLLALPALASRGRRSVASACLLGALAWVLMISFNSNSPYHNFRYYVPALLLVLTAAAVGAAALATALGRASGPWIAGALVTLATIGAGARIPVQVTHFTRSVRNIRDQQIELGLRLGQRLAPGERVLLGDAGAIPFVSGRPAIDALGLGGYHVLPFTRAAVHGEAATVELIERLAPAERPAYLALHPNWFGVLTSRFGVEIERVTLDDNVICAGPTKVIYRADWSALDVAHVPSSEVVDELDVADVMSEQEHAYTPPIPNGGWTTFDILVDRDGLRRFDGGRIIPAGRAESFVVQHSAEGTRDVRLVVRIDAQATGIRVRTSRGIRDLTLAKTDGETWRLASAVIEAPLVGERLTLEAVGGPYRDYHVWISR